jgi:DNA-binding NarL/FixJ family response regulator
VNALQDVKIAIQHFDYPVDRAAFESWKQQTLALLESAGGNGHHTVSNDPPLHARLSPRENEVMSMLLQGRRLKEIAAELQISVKTVTTHRARLLRKLRLEDNLGLYRYGIRNGLISV